MSDLQNKRRRVTRACDECRKKKVKCDGQQPCIHCTVYSYECTYNQPSKRVATASASTAAAAAALTPPYGVSQPSRVKPHKALRDAKLQLSKYKMLFGRLFPQMPPIEQVDVASFANAFQGLVASNEEFQNATKNSHVTVPASSASGAGSPATASATPEGSVGVDAIEGIDGSIQSHEGREIKIILPPKPVALHFIQVTWEQCCVLFRFYHRPSFIASLDELYETDPHDYTHEQMHFLPLCYAVMAVGALFSKSMQSTGTPSDTASPGKFMQDEGYKYFVAARKLIDITNARDLNSIQAIVMLFIFLQCSARLSTCYTYIGVAMRNALREGMHRNLNADTHSYNPIEIEMRKRLFYTIYKMDVYVNTMLGLPRSVSQRDFDQALPAELTDEFITKDGLHFEKQGNVLSSAGIANQHTKLIMILDNIVAELYPVKKTNNLISHDVVTQLELKLRQWLDNLPPELAPGSNDVPPKYERANQLLHLSFLQVQVILYRPFIHYLSATVPTKAADSLSIRRARNCISVARTVVKLAKKMMEKKTLTGSYWFSIYNIFFSVAGLIFYLHEVAPTDEAGELEYSEIQKDAELGKGVLLYLKDTSMAANRTYNLLNMLFEKFNSKTIKWSQVKQGEFKASAPESSQQAPIKTPPVNMDTEPSTYNLDPGNMDLLAFENPQDATLQSTSTISGVNTMNTINTSNMLMNKDFFGVNDSLEMDKFFNLSENGSLDEKAAPLQPSDIQLKEEYEVPSEQNMSESYVPGAFDQLDVQLFGRYLPPYMSQQNESPKFGS